MAGRRGPVEPGRHQSPDPVRAASAPFLGHEDPFR